MDYHIRHPNTPGKTIENKKNGKLVTPPAEHHLSDALAFLVIGHTVVVARNRHAKSPADFNLDGDIYPDRWPIGEPVIMWEYGLPFLAVHADYYVLTGSTLRPGSWLLTRKQNH
ncbi:hypothetical protein N7491_002079 [Penicillium cf. griseofulvum]|uniref:Uncharacterized protein n=1 Tax=Penicillium cf. griseofulvum TaxID=2972120 RepID=A0A9W9T3H0_9EURO|nr:hypothetical protein N7472_003738 [Penicillium cf. griseofulvum]KAJ5445997.1 hypothetical protein N7491_002079 [Penicillium cf. griseofulvum]KAJ5447739.1 hypothetical protein N7445_002560 [Penicillium cf. griseofulvum]